MSSSSKQTTVRFTQDQMPSQRDISFTDPSPLRGSPYTPTCEVSEEELIDWLRLTRTQNVGPVTFFDLMACYASPTEALEALPSLASRGGKDSVHIFSRDDARREIDALSSLGGRFVAYGTDLYPLHLSHIYDAPPLLAVMGDVHLLSKTHQCIGIVGSRNASLNGKKLAHQLGKDLSFEEWVVVSGMARGIDTEAHYGALDQGTVAVLGTGVDVPYPRENKSLYDDILARGGCIVSELPLKTQPLGTNFPRRNRIIAGMAMGVVVVEATLQSGSLITSRYALEYGRDIFAIPGSPFDPRCHGTNDLIRQGAILTESARDVFDIYTYKIRQPLAEAKKRPSWGQNATITKAANDDLATLRNAVLYAMSAAPVPIEELLATTHATPTHLTRVLLEFELAGKVERLPGGRVSLVQAA